MDLGEETRLRRVGSAADVFPRFAAAARALRRPGSGAWLACEHLTSMRVSVRAGAVNSGELVDSGGEGVGRELAVLPGGFGGCE